MKKTLCLTLVIIFLSMLLGTCSSLFKFATLIVKNTTDYPIPLSFEGTEKIIEASEEDGWAVNWHLGSYTGTLRRSSDLKVIEKFDFNDKDEIVYKYLGTE